MKKFASDLDRMDAADKAAARRRQVNCQQTLIGGKKLNSISSSSTESAFFDFGSLLIVQDVKNIVSIYISDASLIDSKFWEAFAIKLKYLLHIFAVEFLLHLELLS